MRDPYLYEDIDVIKNKLGIKDIYELEDAEKAIVPIKLINVGIFEEGKFDFEKLKQVHKHLFGDIYEWAGKLRKINIEKPEKVLYGKSVDYCSHELIEKEAKKIINQMNKVDWEKLDLDKKAEMISKFTSELWQVHSFREGNTRTTITYMELFAKSKGIEIDRELLKNNPGYVRNSLVLASIGEYSEYEHLTEIIKDSIINNDTIIPEIDEKKDTEKLVEKMLNKDPAAIKAYSEIKKKGEFKLSQRSDIDVDR